MGPRWDSNRVWISKVVLTGGRPVGRACITSFRTGEEDLRVLVEELEAARESVAASD